MLIISKKQKKTISLVLISFTDQYPPSLSVTRQNMLNFRFFGYMINKFPIIMKEFLPYSPLLRPQELEMSKFLLLSFYLWINPSSQVL